MTEYARFTSPTSLRIERLLPGPIERAWAYVTESDRRALWFAGGKLDILEDRLRGVEPRPFWTNHAKVEQEYRKRR